MPVWEAASRCSPSNAVIFLKTVLALIIIRSSYLLNILLTRTSGSRGGIVLNKVLKAKKGISPILATLLLIVIAVAAVIVTYAWVMTFTTTQTTTAGKMIKFDSAFINSATDNATIYVRNTGTEVVTIDKIYVDGVDYTSYAQGLQATLTTTGTSSTATVTLNGGDAGLNFASGTTYKMKVTGPGVSWEESIKAN